MSPRDRSPASSRGSQDDSSSTLSDRGRARRRSAGSERSDQPEGAEETADLPQASGLAHPASPEAPHPIARSSSATTLSRPVSHAPRRSCLSQFPQRAPRPVRHPFLELFRPPSTSPRFASTILPPSVESPREGELAEPAVDLVRSRFFLVPSVSAPGS
ncbi:hypothetical protein BJY59DRAFT_714272 [Rhodotorula toruloides]